MTSVQTNLTLNFKSWKLLQKSVLQKVSNHGYFRQFPKIDYDVRGTGIPQKMTDITRRVRFRAT